MGDWIMAWAWCLPAGFSTPLPYFYVVFFAILLFHRQKRDDEACEHKCVLPACEAWDEADRFRAIGTARIGPSTRSSYRTSEQLGGVPGLQLTFFFRRIIPYIY